MQYPVGCFRSSLHLELYQKLLLLLTSTLTHVLYSDCLWELVPLIVLRIEILCNKFFLVPFLNLVRIFLSSGKCCHHQKHSCTVPSRLKLLNKPTTLPSLRSIAQGSAVALIWALDSLLPRLDRTASRRPKVGEATSSRQPASSN